MSDEKPPGKFRISLDDPVTRKVWEGVRVTAREVEQWPTWKRIGDPAARDAALRAFRLRWQAFMEGGWEDVLTRAPEAVEAARRRSLELMPQHPESIRVAEIVARVVDIEKLADEEQLFAALLMSERHGHAVLVAGDAFRPPPRIPRRGHRFEDMYYLLGYAPAREPSGSGG